MGSRTGCLLTSGRAGGCGVGLRMHYSMLAHVVVTQTMQNTQTVMHGLAMHLTQPCNSCPPPLSLSARVGVDNIRVWEETTLAAANKLEEERRKYDEQV